MREWHADKHPRTTIRRLVTLCLADPAQVVDLPPGDLDLLLLLLRRVRLHGRLAADLMDAGHFHRLPQTAQDQLESALVLAEARRRATTWEMDRIAYALRERSNLKIVCLKGCAYMLRELPNVRGRIFADVDLLVSEDRLGEVEHLLNVAGWETKTLSPYDDNYYRAWTHELPPLVHIERDVEVDVHHNIVPRTARLNPSAESLMEGTRAVEGSVYRVPADEDIVLHAMTHLMFDSDLADKLRDLMDIRDLLACFAKEDADFWRRLVQRAEQLDLKRPCYYSLRFVQRLLFIEVPESILECIQGWQPVFPVRILMDRLVPAALLPQHPERPSRVVGLYRLLLFMRSHWIRMPPWLLVYHLGVKFYRTKIRRAPRGREG
jgi:hypothetical protein